MTNMENTVRPFTPVQIHPAASNMSAPLPPGVVECSLGGSGGTTTSFSYNGQTGEVKTEGTNWKETGRTSTAVRIENPEDSSQYVDMCRADKITMQPTDQQQAPPNPPTQSSYKLPDYVGAALAKKGISYRPQSQYEYQYPKQDNESTPPASDPKTCNPPPRDPPRGGKC
jgi:hypothetical protein